MTSLHASEDNMQENMRQMLTRVFHRHTVTDLQTCCYNMESLLAIHTLYAY